MSDIIRNDLRVQNLTRNYGRASPEDRKIMRIVQLGRLASLAKQHSTNPFMCTSVYVIVYGRQERVAFLATHEVDYS